MGLGAEKRDWTERSREELAAEAVAAYTALRRARLGGIADEFADLADAVDQMALYITELERTLQAVRDIVAPSGPEEAKHDS